MMGTVRPPARRRNVVSAWPVNSAL